MLLNRVLAGNAVRLTAADPTLVRPPAGYDSVRGVPGAGLHYDGKSSELELLIELRCEILKIST